MNKVFILYKIYFFNMDFIPDMPITLVGNIYEKEYL